MTKTTLNEENCEGENNYQSLIDTNTYILNQIAYAEAKNGVLITLNSVLIGGIITLLLHDTLELCDILSTYLVVWIIFLVISSTIALSSFVPNFFSNTHEQNIFFYKDIANLTSDEYLKLLKLKEEQLINQNISVSTIATNKMNFFSTAILVGYSLFPFFLVAIIIEQVFRNSSN